jgi:acetyl esterase/lipase
MKKFFRVLVYVLGLFSTTMGIVHLLRVRSARGMVLRTIKSTSEALSPYLAILGTVSALLSVQLHAPLAGLLNGAGALLQGQYLRRISGQRDPFAESFGSRWNETLAQHRPPNQPDRMLRRRWHWVLPHSSQEPRFEQDIVYHTLPGFDDAPGPELHCDLWQPPTGVPTTGLALIYVHGGGYFTSHKDFGTRPFFRHLAEQGHVIMDIDYRLAPTADLFDMLEDVRHAVAWMKQNAEWFGADPKRVVLIGGSAGAHLCLLAAYTAGHPNLTPLELEEVDLSVHAVVSYYGIVDLTATYRDIHRLMARAPHARTLPESFLTSELASRFIDLAAWIRAVDSYAMREYLRENQALMYAGLEEKPSFLSFAKIGTAKLRR